MDIKSSVEELVTKIKNEPDFMNKFNQNPAQAIESVIGVDLPDDQINAIVEGVKAKIGIEKAADKLGAVKNLFGK